MKDSTLNIIQWFAMVATMFAAGWLHGFFIGFKDGTDNQRIRDILELWSSMPVRDSRGRFKSARASDTTNQGKLI